MKAIKRWILTHLPERQRELLRVLGPGNMLVYFFFQRILRINAHVPWPVHWSAVVIAPEKITRIAQRPFPGMMPGHYIHAANGISIGKNVRLAPGVKLISARPDPDDFDRLLPAEPIEISDNCWLGANVIIQPGVKLGNHTVVGAGSVVQDSFPQGNLLLAGTPAKIIRELGAYQDQNTTSSSTDEGI